MYWLILLVFIGLPISMAAFLCWRAYQLSVAGRVELAHQWLVKATPGIEKFAKLFAVRDLIFAFGCLLFVVLLLSMPMYVAAWTSILSAFAFVHQGITYYAAQKAARKTRY